MITVYSSYNKSLYSEAMLCPDQAMNYCLIITGCSG